MNTSAWNFWISEGQETPSSPGEISQRPKQKHLTLTNNHWCYLLSFRTCTAVPVAVIFTVNYPPNINSYTPFTPCMPRRWIFNYTQNHHKTINNVSIFFIIILLDNYEWIIMNFNIIINNIMKFHLIFI